MKPRNLFELREAEQSARLAEVRSVLVYRLQVAVGVLLVLVLLVATAGILS